MGMATPIESSRWRRFQSTEASASRHASASGPRYRLAEDVGILAVVMTELELRQIQWQIFFAHVVVRADHATLQERPERFDIVRVDLAAHVLKCLVVYGLVRKCLMQLLITRAFVRRNQIDFLRNHLADESRHGNSRGIFDNLASEIALARDRADDGNLADRTTALQLEALAQWPVSVLAADIGLVHFDNTHQLLEVGIVHRSAQAMAHIPRRLVGLASDLPLNLKRADAFLAVEHLPDDFKPSTKRVFSVLKNGTADDRKSIGVALATFLVRALPLPRLREFVDRFGLAAARAAHAGRPTAFHQELAARVLSRESRQQLFERHHD
jgi:hypothetical protein